MRDELQALRSEIKALRAELIARLDLFERRLLTRLGALTVVVSGLIIAAVHYWPPP